MAEDPRTASVQLPGTARGFTLVEMMVVILCLCLLAGLVMVAYESACDQVNQTLCLARLKGLGTLLFLYAESYDGYLPDAGGVSPLVGPVLPGASHFRDTWDHPGTAQWPDSRHTGNAGNLYLLVRLQLAEPQDFICPASGDKSALGSPSPKRTSFMTFRKGVDQFTDQQWLFLQETSGRHCSYSYQNVLGHIFGDPAVASPQAAFVHLERSPSDLAILADHNPYTIIRGTRREFLDPNEHPTANSLNHAGRGQNVLYLDGRVQWHTTPECGAGLPDGSRDNIYRPATGAVCDPENIPRHERDSYLVP